MTARFSPTANSLVSTVAGRPGKSWAKWRAPRARFAPPSSTIALITAGFDHGKFDGASASSTLPAAKRAWRSARQPTALSVISPSTVSSTARCVCSNRRNSQLDSHAGSAKRRSRLAGPQLGASAGDAGQLRSQVADAASGAPRPAGQPGADLDGGARAQEARAAVDRVGEQDVEGRVGGLRDLRSS